MDLQEMKVKWLEKKVEALELEVNLIRSVLEIQERKITKQEMDKED